MLTTKEELKEFGKSLVDFVDEHELVVNLGKDLRTIVALAVLSNGGEISYERKGGLGEKLREALGTGKVAIAYGCGKLGIVYDNGNEAKPINSFEELTEILWKKDDLYLDKEDCG